MKGAMPLNPQPDRKQESLEQLSFSGDWSREAIKRRRIELKQRALNMLGGRCEHCGYTGVALEFHHKDPTTKKFNVSEAIFLLRPWAEIEKEIRKCVLLCANHHKEVNAGVIKC